MGCARLSTLYGTISLFYVNVGSFVLLKCVNLIGPAQPTVTSVLCGKKRCFYCGLRGVFVGKLSCIS